MNRTRLIFYAAFGAFHITAFIFTIYLPKIIFQIVSWVPYFKWLTFLGLVLLLIDLFWTYTYARKAEKEKAALLQELNTLKAKLFDYQEAEKKQKQTPQ
jgi:membrane protein implicated in regulation of membrane protease activity